MADSGLGLEGRIREGDWTEGLGRAAMEDLLAGQAYVSDVTPPNWQTLIEVGLLMDLTGQPFVDNYNEATIADAGSLNGGVYAINLGRVSYSGTFLD